VTGHRTCSWWTTTTAPPPAGCNERVRDPDPAADCEVGSLTINVAGTFDVTNLTAARAAGVALADGVRRGLTGRDR
jgi:hypothetical protein